MNNYYAFEAGERIHVDVAKLLMLAASFDYAMLDPGNISADDNIYVIVDTVEKQATLITARQWQQVKTQLNVELFRGDAQALGRELIDECNDMFTLFKSLAKFNNMRNRIDAHFDDTGMPEHRTIQ